MAFSSSKLSFLLLTILLTTLPLTSSQPVPEVVPPKQRVTRMKFYLHEIYQGDNATAGVVVGVKGQSVYGNIGIFDDMIRVGPEPTSDLIGRAQGFVTASSLDGQALLVSLNFVFTAGEFNGSTLASMGRFVLPDLPREWSIVGGTGEFRMASGYVAGHKITQVPDGYLLIEFDDVYIVY